MKNRIFKFRLWNGARIITDNELFDNEFTINQLNWDNYYSMQFTGMYDKNGKEIYEGDFIENTDGIIYKVGFTEGCFDTTYNNIHFIEAKCFYTQNIEVVGNIFENPELL